MDRVAWHNPVAQVGRRPRSGPAIEKKMVVHKRYHLGTGSGENEKAAGKESAAVNTRVGGPRKKVRCDDEARDCLPKQTYGGEAYGLGGKSQG